MIVLNARLLVVSDNEAAFAFQDGRELLQRIHLPLVCTVALAKVVTYLNGKSILGYIEIDFDTRVVIENALIVGVIAIHS